ncbi:carbohydrate-binding domain-containing protein [Actinoplanes sichuanensis]|uniref:Carbohydrate-binding domain-containing protein n=1 Tax=Actinoplanes sichuanensis TaxID=512349 RepID=A0ABW4AGF8_9ACTN|nr:carbohydrate-binding domain-containing protein [Actinoplanes sichuanensis]BEL02421.1 carbohydrate-binding domain-containing protein [Actinoplanes sichuanensis]
MRLRKKVVAAVSSLVLATAMLAGCSSSDATTAATEVAATSTVDASTVDGTQSAETVLAADKSVHTASATTSDTVSIELTGDSATASGDGVTVDGNTVTITAAGTYRVSGELAGQIVVNAPDATVTLILDGAEISSSTGAAIAATEVDQLIVSLADGTTSTLSDASSYAEDADVNAALFSAGDLTITGDGKLTVTGNGNDGIAGKDGVLIESGTITVTAEDDGLRGKDYVAVSGGTITVTAGGDGIKADNDEDTDAGFVSVSGGTITVTSAGDGVDAATDIVVTKGTIAITAGGGHAVKPSDDVSAKGLKSGVITVLEGGTVTVDSSDDAVHTDGAVHFNGAKVTVASGDDGVHAEGQQIIDAGSLEVTSAVEGLEAAVFVLNDGTVHVVSSDDGINGAGGTTGTDTADQGGQQGGGGFPGGGGGPGGGGEEVGDFSVTINGGTLVIDSNGDGLDSNGVASITGGTVVVNGPEGNGNGALDVNGSFTVSGGTLLAAGSAGMVVTPSTDSEQGWISATLDSAIAAGTTVQITDSDGTVVATYVTGKSVQNITFSSSKITSGESYTIHTGGTATGASTGGLAASGSLGSAVKVATVTAGQAPAGGGQGRRGGR